MTVLLTVTLLTTKLFIQISIIRISRSTISNQTADWEPIVTDITVDNKEPTADWEPIAAYDLDTAGQYVSEEHSASTSGPEDVEEINSSVENDAILGFSNAIENLPDQIDYYSEMVANTEPAKTDFRMTTDQGKRESNVGHTGEVELTADEWSKIEEVMARARCEINIDDSFVNRDIVDNEIVHTNIDYPDITVDNKEPTADWERIVADDVYTAGQYVSEEHSASTSGPEDVEEINSSVENDAILGFSNAIENLPDQIDYYSEMVANTEPAETDFRMTTDQGKRESNVGHTGEVELTAEEWSKIEEVMARARCEINIDDSFVNRDIVDNEIVHTNIDYPDITVDNKQQTADWQPIVTDITVDNKQQTADWEPIVTDITVDNKEPTADWEPIAAYDLDTAGQYVSEEHSASTSGPEDVEEINSSVENDAILGFSNAIENLPDQIDYYSEMVANTEPAKTDFRMTTDQGKRESNVGHTGEVELTADEWSKIEEVMARARCEINIDDSFVNRDIVDNEIVHTNIDYPDITVDNKQQTADWEPIVTDITRQ